MVALHLLIGTAADRTGYRSFDELIGDYMRENHVPGLAFAVVDNHGISLSGAYGLADVGQDIPMRRKIFY